jgi:hypothetical protein
VQRGTCNRLELPDAITPAMRAFSPGEGQNTHALEA